MREWRRWWRLSLFAAGLTLTVRGSALPIAVLRDVPTDNTALETDVSVTPGSYLRIEASGCVGKYTYVQPWRRVPQGLIFVPGVTATYIPIADLAGRVLHVPATVSVPGDLKMWLTFGPYYHHEVEEAQLVTAGPLPCTVQAAPIVTVEEMPRPPDAATPGFDLQFGRYDYNRLPLNPQWLVTKPDTCRDCNAFPYLTEIYANGLQPLNPETCTSQRPYVDVGECGFGDTRYCSEVDNDKLKGHINWGPVAFTGTLTRPPEGECKYLNLDGDIEFLLKPDGGAGLTSACVDEYAGSIGLEFASYETIRRLYQGWWSTLSYKKQMNPPFPSYWTHVGVTECQTAPDLDDRSAYVVGIMGLDNEHFGHPELHPVYAVAFRKSDGTWEVLARNWGNEGDCGGGSDHRLEMASLALRLPESAGLRPGRFEVSIRDETDVKLTCSLYQDDQGVFVVVPLQPPAGHHVAYGEVRFVEGASEGGVPVQQVSSYRVPPPVRLDVVEGVRSKVPPQARSPRRVSGSNGSRVSGARAPDQ